MSLPFQVEQEERKGFKPPHLRFEDVSFKDNAASLKAGRAIFNPGLVVFLRSPGDEKCETPYVVEQIQKNAEGKEETIYPWLIHLKEKLHHEFISKAHYDFCINSIKHWKENQETMVQGTPITEWPLLKKSEADNLKSIGILSIEQCAEMTEEAMSSYGMGARTLKEKADSWINANSNPGQAAEKISALQSSVDAATEQAQKAENLVGGYEQKIAQLEAMIAANNTPAPPAAKMDFTTLEHQDLVDRVKQLPGQHGANLGWSKEVLIGKLEAI